MLVSCAHSGSANECCDGNRFRRPCSNVGSCTHLLTLTFALHKGGSKALVSVGGWTGSRFFSKHMSTSARRTQFANQLVQFTWKYGFDGIDLDWEYPNAAGIGCNSPSSADSGRYLQFLPVLRQKLGKTRLITAAVSVNGFIGANGNALASFRSFANTFDYINLSTFSFAGLGSFAPSSSGLIAIWRGSPTTSSAVTYDIGGPWSSNTSPNAPLRTCASDTSVTQAIQLFTSRGFPAKKILLYVVIAYPTFTYTFLHMVLATLILQACDATERLTLFPLTEESQPMVTRTPPSPLLLPPRTFRVTRPNSTSRGLVSSLRVLQATATLLRPTCAATGARATAEDGLTSS